MGWFENLRTLKAKSNMSMREIAVKSGIPEPTLEKIFSGATKNPGVNTVQSVVHTLGYTLNDIDPTPAKKNSDEAEAKDPLREVLLENFNQLNQEGRERLVETSDDMVASGKYIKSGKNIVGTEKPA